MKNTSIYLYPLTLFISLFQLSFNQLGQGNKFNESKGFKDYIFGTSPDNYKNLTLEIAEGNTKLYSLDQTTITIDGVDMNYIRLTFTKNKLSNISLQSKNSGGEKLLQQLKETYGEPTRISPTKKSYEWLSDKLHLLYEKDTGGTNATVSFSNKKMFN